MTETQLELPLHPLDAPEYSSEMSIAERFAAFDKANPWVANALERLAADELENGATRIGVKALAEVLRWHHRRARTPGEVFKINNSYVSLYARLLLERHPEWAPAIELRTLRAE